MRKALRLFIDLLVLPITVPVGFLFAILGNYSTVLQFFPRLGEITKNPQVTAILLWYSEYWGYLFLSFVIIFMFINTYRIVSKYWWIEPKISFSTKKDRIITAQRNSDCVSLIVHNHEEIAITNCYATLITATILYGEDMSPLDIVNKGRLKWIEGKYSNEDCEITIPPMDEKAVGIADNQNAFQFSFCNTSLLRHDLMGLYSPIKIRVDGKINSRDMKPQFFEGYLYVNNYMGSTGEVTITTTDPNGEITKTINPSRPEIYTTLIFEKGNWLKDKRLLRFQNMKDKKTATNE